MPENENGFKFEKGDMKTKYYHWDIHSDGEKSDNMMIPDHDAQLLIQINTSEDEKQEVDDFKKS